MNSSFPPMPTVRDPVSDGRRPFEWIDELAGFWRRNRNILLCAVSATMLLGLCYLLIARPRFTAVTTLLIDQTQSELVEQHATISDAQIENARMESEVEVLRSAGLARKVVTRLGLASDPDFNQPASFLSKLLSRLSPTSASGGTAAADAGEERLVAQLLSMVAPHRIGLTYVIEIDATATSPILAARLANGLADAYVAEQQEVKAAALRQATGWLQARLLQLHDQAVAADQAVQLFKSGNGIVDTGHGLLGEQQIIELNSQLVAARGRVAEATARRDRIRQMRGSRDGASMATSAVLQSPVINGLRERYLADAQRVAEWSARYGRDHGAAVLLRREMAQLQASIDSETRRIEATADSDVDVARAGEAAIQAQLDAVVGQSETTDRARATLRSLQSSADTYRSLYAAFLQRATQATQDESFPVADVRVVTRAWPPLTKSRPQGKLILVGAAILGLGMGFVLGLLRDALDRRIHDGASLASQTGLSCLASLPAIGPSTAHPWRSRNRRGPRDGTTRSVMQRYAVDNPDTAFGRGISRLRLRLQQRMGGGGGRLIGLIAPTEGAGTTTVAANLVQSFLKSGYDAKLLASAECMGSRRQVRAALEPLRRSHDVVVIDLPPLSRPGEAHAAFAEIEDIVLLVDAGRLDGAALLDRLRDGGLDPRSLSGVVVNNVRDHPST